MVNSVRQRKLYLPIILILCIIFIGSVDAQAYLRLMSPVPTVVQSENAQLAFRFMLSKPMDAGSWIRLGFPKESGMVVSKDIKECVEVDNQFQITACTANVDENYLQFTIARALTLTEGSTTADFEIRASSAIGLPTTVATVDPITLTAQTSEVRATAFKATTGVLTNVTLKPAVETVGSDTTLSVSLTTAHRIPKKGLLHVGVSAPWNDGAPGRAIQYFSAVSCAALTVGGTPVAAGTYACSFLDESRVEITGGFPEGVPANTEIKVEIAGFRNPIQAVDAFEVFTVYTSGADRTHTVDNSTAAVTVSQPAALTAASFRVAPAQLALLLGRPGVVQEPNVMDLKFYSPVPLRIGCRVRYWFPTAFYDASDIRTLRTGALLGQSKETYYPAATAQPGEKTFTVRDVPPAEDIQKVPGGYKEVAFTSCSTFRGQTAPEATRIEGLKQPPSTQPTPSLQIHLHDAGGEPIASIVSGVGFTPMPGTLSIEPPTLTQTVISSLATLTWTIYPGHGLSAASSPSVTVVLPSDYVVQPSCTPPPSAAGGVGTRSCSVNQIENSITIEQVVAADAEGGAALSFEIGQVQLPGTTAGGQGEFRITTYVKDATSDRRYMVDTGAASALFTMTAGNFAAASVAPASKQAVVQTDYTFSVTPAHPIPQYGLIMVQYPNQVEIEDSSLSQTLCNTWNNFPSGTAVCTIFPANQTLIVNKGFQSGPGGAGNTSAFSWVLPYVTNPTTLQETDSFKITTRDQYFSLIDEVTTGVTIQMAKAAEFRSESLVLGSYQNTARTSYSFSVVAATPIQSTDYILVTFPNSYELPDDEEELACKSSTIEFVSQLTCTKSSSGGKAILIELTIVKEIPALETLNFVIQRIMNPNSTYPTDPIKVQVFDSKELTRGTNQDTGSLVVVTSIPYTVGPEDATIASSVHGAGLASVYTLTMSLKHGLAAGGGLLVRYPPEMVHADDVEVEVDASEYGCPEPLTKPELDYSARQILFVESPFTTALVVKPESPAATTLVGKEAGQPSDPTATGAENQGAGAVNDKSTTKANEAGASKAQKLTITIRGLANPYNNAASSSFEIVTFDSEKKASGTVLYFVDQVDGGLTIDSPCAFPCKECSSGAPTSCLACFPGSANSLLQESTCLAACSDGRYFDSASQRCELCDSTCLTCEGAATTCTSCGVGEFLHLRGEECVARCGDGYIDDPSNNRCLQCREGCSTCSVSTTNCTSCEATGATPWNFRFDCLATCPPKIGVERGEQCLECSTKCKTCSGDPGTCTSCESYMRFDPLNNDCLEACQPQTQIYQEKTGECETCHEDCASCVEGVNTCTSCKADFVLNLDSSCKTECLGDTHQTPIAATCRECEEPCSKCSGSVDTCIACIPSFLLYKGTCVDHCPDRYEENDAPVKQCILVGLICPAGFDVNEEGEGCVPKEFECKEGYEINEKRTACIPAPGSPVPFPFIFTAICLGLVVAGSYIKDKDGTKVYTCLIFLVSSLELLEYLLIAIFAALLEQFFASFLAFVAVIVLISSNIAFTVCYQRYTTKDKVYADWIRLFPKTEAVLPVVCALINFSTVRFVFSGFFGMDNCLANFHEPRSAVHRHLQTLTYVKYVFVYIPIFIADILIISFVGWGHQLLVLAIETLVLQLFTIYLTFQEFKDPEKLYADRGEEYSPLKSKQHGQIAVMGAYEEDGMDETHLVRQERVSDDYKVALRKKALTAILQQVGENFFTSQKKGVDIGGQISKVFSKFDKDQLKRRRAVSEDMTAERTNGTDGTTADDESDESTESFIGKGLARRYSFPMLGGIEDDVADPSFREQLDKIKDAAFEEQYKDNVYADIKPESGKTQHQKKKKLVNRRTQTYLRELLQLDGEELQDSDMEIVMEEEAEIDDQYTKGIIKDLIEGISESSNRESSMTGAKRRFKKQKDLGRAIPDFELTEIMGEFEIDDAGNYIILRGEGGELLDRHERLVNKRGYLVDMQGNIVNTNQEIILRVYELDADGEIPASCGFEKRKQNLLSMGEGDQFKVNSYGQGPGKGLGQDGDSQNDEDIVERQFNALKRGEGASSRSGSRIEEPLAGDQNFMVDEHGNIDDMIDIITKKTVPVKKDTLRANRGRGNSPGGASRESGSRVAKKQPAKRFRPGDQMYFPAETTVSYQDQKLQQITQSIGGFGSGLDEHMAGENMDLSEIRGRSQLKQPEAGQEEANGSTQARRAPLPIVTSDFYASGGPQEGSYSILSQDIVYLNDTLAPRPGTKGTKGLRDAASNELGQLRKVYGKDASGRGKRADHSPKHAGTRSRQESQGARVFSADPRLRGLENIYLTKFSSQGSQKNIGLKKPFQSKKSRRVGAANLNTDDQSRARELRSMNNQRHALVSETIDRLEQVYQASGGGHQSAIGLHTEGFLDSHSQIPRLSQQDPQARSAARQASAHHPGPGLAPIRAHNWLAADTNDEF